MSLNSEDATQKSNVPERSRQNKQGFTAEEDEKLLELKDVPNEELTRACSELDLKNRHPLQCVKRLMDLKRGSLTQKKFCRPWTPYEI